MKRGFTLVELLVAVLIIGVLTAMALPMYQKSVDKSRYATLMPLAKNIKDAQEAFYLGGGKYSKDLGSLDVRVPGNPSGATATLSDGTTVEISTTDGYGYVKLSKNNLNNNYIIYQDRSANYPGEIHCEALTDSDRANELCQNLGGQKISGSLTDGYTTYILSGTGAGIAPDLNQEAENHGNWQSCDTYPCTKACDRTVKTGYDCNGTYNEDHTYTEQVCQEDICVITEYDEDGKKLKKTVCENSAEAGFCRMQTESIYDENGHLLSDKYCQYYQWNDASTCGEYRGNIYGYENGELTDYQICWGYDESGACSSLGGKWMFSEENNTKTEATCYSVDDNGNCSYYGMQTKSVYDNAGNILFEQKCFPDSSTGVCSSVATVTKYIYDDGKLVSERSCANYNLGDMNCDSYGNTGYDYGYNAQGQKVVRATCDSVHEDGSCASKSNSNVWAYSYDDNGNMVFARQCSGYDFDTNTCGTGQYYGGFAYTYDEQGNQTSQRYCQEMDSEGNCTRWHEACYFSNTSQCV